MTMLTEKVDPRKIVRTVSVLQEASLRDRFAMAAMQGLLASDARFCREDYDKTVDLIAATAYEQADAMLAAREEK